MKPSCECRYETLGRSIGVDWISRKKQSEKSELVLNPNMFPEINAYLEDLGWPPISEKFLNDTCRGCEECFPTITKDGDGFRIIRKYYTKDEAEKPLFTITEHKPEVIIPSPRRVCTCDDDRSSMIADQIAECGHRVWQVSVNPYVHATLAGYNELVAAIRGLNADYFVSDKGLWEIDGIRLIEDIGATGPITIMYTGEIQTDATRKVTFFVEKPHYKEILEYIR
jgi:hypothetical protein